jgi:uncharacterized paraquat-inducible protein A
MMERYLFPMEGTSQRKSRCWQCSEPTNLLELKTVQMGWGQALLCPQCFRQITRRRRKPKLPKYDPDQMLFDFMVHH